MKKPNCFAPAGRSQKKQRKITAFGSQEIGAYFGVFSGCSRWFSRGVTSPWIPFLHGNHAFDDFWLSHVSWDRRAFIGQWWSVILIRKIRDLEYSQWTLWVNLAKKTLQFNCNYMISPFVWTISNSPIQKQLVLQVDRNTKRRRMFFFSFVTTHDDIVTLIFQFPIY